MLGRFVSVMRPTLALRIYQYRHLIVTYRHRRIRQAGVIDSSSEYLARGCRPFVIGDRYLRPIIESSLNNGLDEGHPPTIERSVFLHKGIDDVC